MLACANAADAVEVLAVGFFLTVYKTKSGRELTSGEKGMCSVYKYLVWGIHPDAQTHLVLGCI